jgi:hypothetical protein
MRLSASGDCARDGEEHSDEAILRFAWFLRLLRLRLAMTSKDDWFDGHCCKQVVAIFLSLPSITTPLLTNTDAEVA